ncbi:DUF4249 family protein [Rhodothermus profundi]|uniref:DUF4249 family protein n=1 Tax=Rhodothermus profundi TaxID=633813 RepID=A0A1M6TE85_9BACT|nr:DUF4249 family protein [Rhodothermus profundi]SHK55146.1 protein of unknown function [Rhodothermus profundi]
MKGRIGLLLLIGWAVGCDTVVPGAEPVLVVEAFLETGAPPPAIRLRQTGPLTGPYDPDGAQAVTDARVTLALDTLYISYRPDPAAPGYYRPERLDLILPPQMSFVLEIQWRGLRIYARDALPPPIQIDSVQVSFPDVPVPAVLLDSLVLNDSLAIGARKGYLYPVEVTLWWHAPDAPDSSYWVRPHLQPAVPFSSVVVDLFLRTEQVLLEQQSAREPDGRRRWTGVYAVPVDSAQAPLPAHTLRVALLRSGQAYARFAATRESPERREPVSNVVGGLGIVAGIALDSLRLTVAP